MPAKPHRPCLKAGCGETVQGGGYCEQHKALRTGWNRSNEGKTAAQRGYGATWRKQRAKVLKRDKGLCQVCLLSGRYMVGNQVDHITPKAKGGTDALTNLQVLCVACHNAKTVKER